MKRLNKEELNKLPKEVIKEAKNTLKAYGKVNVIFQNGNYKVQCGSLLLNEYPEDFKVIGTAYAEDIFDEKDRMINYIEGFHSYPIEYKGKKDWGMIRELKELRSNYKKGIIDLDEFGNAFIKDVVTIEI